MSNESSNDTSPASMAQTGLTREQQQKWEDTMSMMVWTAPGFQHILYKLLNAQNNARSEYVAIMSKQVPIACTDGKNIIVNPDTFFAENIQGRTYIIGHEIIHNVFGDVEMLHRCVTSGSVPMNDGTNKPFDNDTMQKSMDARINALLDESRIGRHPKIGGHYDKAVKGSDSVLDIYKKYYEDKFPDTDKDGDGPSPNGDNPGGFDSIMKPGSATGQNPQQAAQQRNPQQWAVEIAAAQTIEQARSQGKMAAGLRRMFQQLLEPEVPWVDHIETLINRACGGGGYDWTQPDPWLGSTESGDEYFAPSETGHGAGWIVQWGDTSGSRNDQEIASQIGETAGIMEAVNPRRLTIIWADAALHDGSIVEINDCTDLKDLKPVGGGGTDYECVLDWIKEQDEVPDLFIGFTDGFVTHVPEKEFPCPVIWASSTDQQYPFGQVVRVNKVARAR